MVIRRWILIVVGLLLGIGIGLGITSRNPALFLREYSTVPILSGLAGKEVIGFLPYWLLTNAHADYSPYITTLTYFGLRIDTDGSILKRVNEQETEPGWQALRSGKLSPFFQAAQEHAVSLSLLLTAGDDDSIAGLVAQPTRHAQKFVSEVTPILDSYHFSDLNLDIEYTQLATPAAQMQFTEFVKTVRNTLSNRFSLTVEITGDDLIREKLIDPTAVGQIAENVVLMAYDFHYPGSIVSGAVAPLSGAGTTAEYDVTSALQLAMKSIPKQKIILGVPLYGYEWETLGISEHSATIPGTGIAASNRRAEKFAATCATCSAQFNLRDQEVFLSYKDPTTGTYHQMVYPDSRSTAAKVDLANATGIQGLALWALGYEGKAILDPLRDYK